MAKQKHDPNWLSKELARVKDALGTVVDERWYVVEITPAYRSWGYDSGWVSEVRRVVSPFFKEKKYAEHFIETHDPDHKDNHFEIKSQKLYERTVREWR